MNSKLLIIAESVNAEFISKLEQQYTKVINVSNVVEALEALRTSNITVILCDIDSIELIANAQNQIKKYNIPILFGSLDEKSNILPMLCKTDILTGLPNKEQFYSKATKLCEEIRNDGAYLSLVMMDMDFFRQVNEEQGHLAGDEILTKVSKKIQSSLREQDIVARFGGEEFIIALPYTDIDQAFIVIERLRKKIKKDLRITASFGVASYIYNEKLSDLINRADKALYEAKNQGRDSVKLS